MKFLLIIPVLALLISNIPLKLEMSAPSGEMKETCPMKKQAQMRCIAKSSSSNQEGCCKKETSCICFYGFQVLAPNQNVGKFSFQLSAEKSLNGYYLQSNWINPFIDGPLQPPDIV